MRFSELDDVVSFVVSHEASAGLNKDDSGAEASAGDEVDGYDDGGSGDGNSAGVEETIAGELERSSSVGAA